jgi:membrane protease YdiL (CAAX protease family)
MTLSVYFGRAMDRNTARPAIGLAVALVLATLLLVIVANIAMASWNPYLRLAVTEYVCILGPAVLFVLRKKLTVVEGLRLHPVSPRLLVYSSLIGIGGYGVATCLMLLLRPLLGEVPQEFSQLTPTTWPQLIGLLLAGAVGAGLCEEILFRGVVQGLLIRRGRWFAIMVTAIMFGLFHLNTWQFVAGIVLGVCFGWMVERSGSLWASITAHTCANVTAFVLAFVFGGQLESEPWSLLLALACLSPIGIVLFHRQTRRTVPQPPPLSLSPARLPRWVKWTALTPASLLVLMIGARAVGAVQVHRLAVEIPELQVGKGDVAISLSRQWFPVTIERGDGVTFRQDGRTKIRCVQRMELDQVIVEHEGQEIAVNHKLLVGKVVHWFRVSAQNNGKQVELPRTKHPSPKPDP